VNRIILADFKEDKTVPKPVLDILAEMIAADSGLKVGPFASGPGSDSGMPTVGLD
jgi:import receptor subunit TOM20